MSAALRALAATLILELPVVALSFPGQRGRLTLVALIANVGTNLTLNVLLPGAPGLGGHHVLVGEALAVVGEALAYAAASRPHDLGRSFIVSGASNALSYELGGLIAAWLPA